MKNTICKTLLFTFVLLPTIAINYSTNASTNSPTKVTHQNDNHLFTAYFKRPELTCTAVALSSTTAITAGHCVGYNYMPVPIPLGKIYPGHQPRYNPVGHLEITTKLIYPDTSLLGSKDIALLKGSEPTPKMRRFFKDKSPKIKPIDDITQLKGQSVYSIGYPGGQNPVKQTGTVTGIDGGNGITDLPNIGAGRSGAGLFLENTDELIGIVYGSTDKETYFASISSNVVNWINENKMNKKDEVNQH